MALDTIVTLSAFGGLLLLNIISLICVYCTAYGKSWIYNTMKSESKGYFIFWNVWMIFTGICFWIATFFQWIRYGKGDYSDFKNVSAKEVVDRLKEAWNSKK